MGEVITMGGTVDGDITTDGIAAIIAVGINQREGSAMKATLVTVVGMTALMSSGAISAPLNAAQIAGSSNAKNVRLVCNEYGHCWRSRGPRYVVREYDNYRVRRSYGYYGDGPRYHGSDGYYGGGPSIGLSFGSRGW